MCIEVIAISYYINSCDTEVADGIGLSVKVMMAKVSEADYGAP